MASEESKNAGQLLAKRAGTVAVFTMASRILGLAREQLFAHVFGASAALDAFITALTIPNTLRRLTAEGALMIAFVPLLAEEKRESGLDGVRRYARAVLGMLLPVLLALSLAGVIFPAEAVALFAPHFDPERAALAVRLTQIMMPFIMFVSLVAVAGALLNTQGIFAPTAAAPVLLNLCIISAVYVSWRFLGAPISPERQFTILGISGWSVADFAAVGVVTGGVAQLLLQLPALRKQGLLVGPSTELGHPRVKVLLLRMVPALYGAAVYQINIIIIRRIASGLPAGQLSCYNYATRLEELALGVFAVSLSIAALPTLSEHAAAKDIGRFKNTFLRAVSATNFLTVPSMLGLLALATPIVSVLFRHGAFSEESAVLTANLLSVLAFALFPIGMIRVFVPTFYALGDTRTPVIAATVSMVLTYILGNYLGDRYQILGMTVGTMVAHAGQFLVLVLVLNRKAAAHFGAESKESVFGISEALRVLRHAGKCFVAVAAPCALAFWLQGQLEWVQLGLSVQTVGALAALVGMVVIVYFFSALKLRLDEASLVLGAVGRRLKR